MNIVKTQSLVYLVGRGLYGLMSFLAISLYTRLLSPTDYGNYTLVTTTVAIANMLFYQWQRVSVLRLFPINSNKPNPLFASTTISFFLITLITLLIGVPIIYWGKYKGISINLMLIGITLLWTEALFELIQEFNRADFLPKIYTVNSTIKAFIALTIGFSLIYIGFDSLGIFSGLIIANVWVIIKSRKLLFKLLSSIKQIDVKINKEFIRYGTPFIISFAFSCILNLSDRYFINYYIGKTQTGYYAVGYELARQSIWIIMQAINLAYYPIIVKILEQDGRQSALIKLEENFLLLASAAIPIAVGISVLSENITSIFLGPLFAVEVYKIMPLSALSAVLSGFYGFYFIQAFQLGRKTHLQLWPVGLSALIHILLNFLLIPSMGITGALTSTIICDLITLIVSYQISYSSFSMPIPWKKTGLILIGSGVMGLIIIVVKPYIPHYARLPVLVPLGGITYVTMISIFDIIDPHIFIKNYYKKLNGKI